MTSPSFRSADENRLNTAGNSLTVTAPSGIADDDILIYLLDRADHNESITWPAGFEANVLFQSAYAGGSLAAAWKRASSESGDYTTSWTTNTRAAACMFAISGVDTGDTPLSGTTAFGSGTLLNPPSVDPGSSGDRLAVICLGQEGKDDNRFTTPALNYTQPAAANIGTTGGGAGTGHCGCAMEYRQYTGQAEDPGVVTSSRNDSWAANTISLAGVAGPTIIAVGIAAETATAFSVNKAKSIVQAAETAMAFSVSINRTYSVTHASETDTAFVVHKGKGVVQAIETDTAFSVSAVVSGLGAKKMNRIVGLETRRFLVER